MVNYFENCLATSTVEFLKSCFVCKGMPSMINCEHVWWIWLMSWKPGKKLEPMHLPKGYAIL